MPTNLQGALEKLMEAAKAAVKAEYRGEPACPNGTDWHIWTIDRDIVREALREDDLDLTEELTDEEMDKICLQMQETVPGSGEAMLLLEAISAVAQEAGKLGHRS